MQIRVGAIIVDPASEHVATLEYRSATGYRYTLPGGRVQSNENLREALLRELKEELCIERVANIVPTLTCETLHGSKRTLHFVYSVGISVNDLAINPRETTAVQVVYLNPVQMLQVPLYPSIASALGEIVHPDTKWQFKDLGVIDQPFVE